MPLQFVAQGPMALPSGVTPVGIGDILGTALAYWGLMPITAAYATGLGAAFRIVDVNGNNPTDIHFKSDGTLNETEIQTAITSFGANVPAHMDQIYDQSGGGQNLGIFTASLQPVVVQSGIGVKSVLDFGTTRRVTGVPTISITQSQPFTIVGTMNRTSGTTAGSLFGFSNSTQIIVGFDGSAATGSLNAGIATTFPGVTDAAWNAVQVVFSGSSSKVYINGSSQTITPSSPGANGFVASSLAAIGSDNFGNFFPNGRATQVGIWAGDQSTNFAAVDSRIRTYWGF